MCGYIGNLHDAPGVIEIMDELGIQMPLPYFQSYQRRMHKALITAEEGKHLSSEAMWWYALTQQNGRHVPNPDITSFNARNLDGRMWRSAVATRRGLVFGTEIGESQGRNQYLMRSGQGLALGAVYKDWFSSTGEKTRSMAIITRAPHPRFSQYHDKSIPMFLPMDADTLRMWLDPSIDASHPVIADLLNSPRIYTPLNVTRVKTFKRAEALSDAELLEADDQNARAAQ